LHNVSCLYHTYFAFFLACLDDVVLPSSRCLETSDRYIAGCVRLCLEERTSECSFHHLFIRHYANIIPRNCLYHAITTKVAKLHTTPVQGLVCALPRSSRPSHPTSRALWRAATTWRRWPYSRWSTPSSSTSRPSRPAHSHTPLASCSATSTWLDDVPQPQYR
jgi:hypothetical protein